VVTALLLATTPAPSPTTTTPAVDADLVTPGLWGFVTLFVLAVGVYFLARSMARRVQRVNQRARLEEQEAAERAAAEPVTTSTSTTTGDGTAPDGEAPGGSAPGGTTPGTTPEPDRP